MTWRRNTLIAGLLFSVAAIVLTAGDSIEKLFYAAVAESDSDDGDTGLSGESVRGAKTFAVKLPKTMTFGGEQVPLKNMDVRERFDRELTVNSYWHSSTILMMKRANRWFPAIEKVLREEGVPEDFKYLALAESGLQHQVSPAGATGFWQIMPAAGKELGLVMDNEIDERYHVEKSTRAAARYLKKLHAEFGSWSMAAAAYNMGQTGLRRQVERQGEGNYYDLLLNDETSRYVFRILALKAIFSAPQDFGFELESSDMYRPYKYRTETVDYPVESWADFCEERGITYRELKLLNPWLREAHLTNPGGKAWEVKIWEG